MKAKEIKLGCYASDIIENGSKGSDIVDYLLSTKRPEFNNLNFGEELDLILAANRVGFHPSCFKAGQSVDYELWDQLYDEIQKLKKQLGIKIKSIRL